MQEELTMRDFFAGFALGAAMDAHTLRLRTGVAGGKPALPDWRNVQDAIDAATIAYNMADAMMVARDA